MNCYTQVCDSNDITISSLLSQLGNFNVLYATWNQIMQKWLKMQTKKIKLVISHWHVTMQSFFCFSSFHHHICIHHSLTTFNNINTPNHQQNMGAVLNAAMDTICLLRRTVYWNTWWHPSSWFQPWKLYGFLSMHTSVLLWSTLLAPCTHESV